MKCPFCGGSGVNETWVATEKVSEYKQTCFKCHGKGEWDCTNEEFIRHCTTEELAEFLFQHGDCIGCPASREICHRQYDDCKTAFLEWLKEKHNIVVKQPHKEE